jgi:outer membrane lipoprotein-sorting protein
MGLITRRLFPPERPEPDEVDSVIRFWSDPPSRLRQEVESNSAERGSHVMVAEGGRWWAYSPETGAVTNEETADEQPDTAAAYGDPLWRSLLDPADWIPALRFEPRGDIEALGRAAVLVAATTREHSWPAQFPFALQQTEGADGYELVVDRERGVVLRVAATLDGEVFWSSEFEELVFDEELGEGLFVFEPPPGVEVRSMEHRPPDRLTVAEAAKRAPFDVFHIPQLPDGRWDVQATYRDESPGSESVHLFYHRADAQDHVTVVQTAADGDEPPWPGLTRIEHDGLVLDVARPVPGLDAPLHVLLERDGTKLQLTSHTLDEDTLLALAASMQRVA